jgi:hypothetical protein
MRRGLGVLALSLLPALGCFHAQFKTKPRVADVDGDPIVQMAPAQKLPSLENPSFSPWKRHTDPPAPWEPVLGFGDRGYPVGILDRYEVVNDGPSASPYVVARCPLAGVTAAYDRRVGGRTLTFVNSGALWRDTLVLKDLETGTLWTAATGRAIFGPLAGEELAAIPVVLATMNAFATTHPRARFLDTGEMSETPLSLSVYEVSPWQGVSGVRTEDPRYEPKAKLYSVSEGAEAVAFAEDDVKGKGCVETELAGAPLSIEWDPARDAPRAFREGGRREVAVVPMYWFALDRHFSTVRTLAPPSGPAGTEAAR